MLGIIMVQNDLDYYGIYGSMLTGVLDGMLSEVNRILEDMTADAEYSPVEHIRSRIKGAESIREKLRKNGFPEDIGTGLQSLSDIVGIRIVTHFIGDVYAILEALKESGYWEIFKVKDYIANPKSNGYRSLHILLRIPVDCPDFTFVMAEIQLRTVAMDCWASLEHQMAYKKAFKNKELIVAELKRCADEIASTDLSLQTIKELLQT